MIDERTRFLVIVGSVIAVLLQIVIAPNIAIAGAMPNFLLVFAMIVAIACPSEGGVVLPFVMGMIFDLMGGGPVGAMAFLLIVFSFAASRAFAVLDNENLFMPFVTLVVSMLVVEVLYGVFLIWFSVDVSFADAFLYRGLPCALYDAVVGLVLYPILSRVLSSSSQPGMPQFK